MSDFFKKISTGINKGVTAVGANSKAMLEKSKINGVIKNLKDENKQLAELLGMRVFEIAASGKEVTKEDIVNFTDQMSKHLQQIAEQEELLKQVDEEVSLATNKKVEPVACECGNVNSPGVKYCSKCGKALS